MLIAIEKTKRFDGSYSIVELLDGQQQAYFTGDYKTEGTAKGQLTRRFKQGYYDEAEVQRVTIEELRAEEARRQVPVVEQQVQEEIIEEPAQLSNCPQEAVTEPTTEANITTIDTLNTEITTLISEIKTAREALQGKQAIYNAHEQMLTNSVLDELLTLAREYGVTEWQGKKITARTSTVKIHCALAAWKHRQLGINKLEDRIETLIQQRDAAQAQLDAECEAYRQEQAEQRAYREETLLSESLEQFFQALAAFTTHLIEVDPDNCQGHEEVQLFLEADERWEAATRYQECQCEQCAETPLQQHTEQYPTIECPRCENMVSVLRDGLCKTCQEELTGRERAKQMERL